MQTDRMHLDVLTATGTAEFGRLSRTIWTQKRTFLSVDDVFGVSDVVLRVISDSFEGLKDGSFKLGSASGSDDVSG